MNRPPMKSPLFDAEFGPDRLWISSRVLSGLPSIKHAISTRHLSKAPDEHQELAQRLQQTLEWSQEKIWLAEQVHGGAVKVISKKDVKESTDAIEVAAGADALIAECPGIMLAVFTADCVPILFADGEIGLVGAVHAGWRGTMERVLTNAIEAAFGMGAHPDRLRVWIGPCISGAAYEVSPELAERFANEFPSYAMAAVKGRHVDLVELNRRQAISCGLKPEHIKQSGICTMNETEDFFSYRAEGDRAGRMAAGIMLAKKS